MGLIATAAQGKALELPWFSLRSVAAS